VSITDDYLDKVKTDPTMEISDNYNIPYYIYSGFYANIPSTFTIQRDRSDSASSRASSHKSLPSEAYGSSPEPV